MPAAFEKKLANFVKANGLFESVDKILLAVSGGADSTALMYAMSALKAEGVFSAELLCAHINHQLRGTDAELDEEFIISEAGKLRLSVTTKRLDVRGFACKNKLSIETAARKQRIESLLNIAKVKNYPCIATGHQKNDNAETVLQRLVRGTGFRGLGGIWPARSFADKIRFARPLLCVRRDEIVEYLRERNIKWRTDHTNYDCTYRRNFIRHLLLPALQRDCSGSIVEQLFELALSARKFYELVCNEVEKIWPEVVDCADDKVIVDLKRFSIQHPAVKVELIRRGLAAIGSGERDLTHGHYERILQLEDEDISGRKITLPSGFVACREYGNLIFALAERAPKPDEEMPKTVSLQIPGRTKFGQYLIEAVIFDAEQSHFEKLRMDSCLRRNDIEKNRNDKEWKSKIVEWFDLEKVSLPVTVRFREAGDRFWPLGLAGEKKVSKFLTAAKVPQETRRKVLIVADSEKIIWVWPIRISEETRIGSGTQNVLQMRITDMSSA